MKKITNKEKALEAVFQDGMKLEECSDQLRNDKDVAMGLKTRLETLWKFIDEHLEIDYGYLPKSHMDDKDDSRVDEYIQEIKNDFESMRERGVIKPSSINESIEVLKGLDDI